MVHFKNTVNGLQNGSVHRDTCKLTWQYEFKLPEPTRWQERTDSWELSFDLQVCTLTFKCVPAPVLNFTHRSTQWTQETFSTLPAAELIIWGSDWTIKMYTSFCHTINFNCVAQELSFKPLNFPFSIASQSSIIILTWLPREYTHWTRG